MRVKGLWQDRSQDDFIIINSSKTYAVIMENVNVEISSTIDEGKHFVVESQTTIEILNRCLSQSLLLYRFQTFS